LKLSNINSTRPPLTNGAGIPETLGIQDEEIDFDAKNRENAGTSFREMSNGGGGGLIDGTKNHQKNAQVSSFINSSKFGNNGGRGPKLK
jgi:hypothetical protein